MDIYELIDKLNIKKSYTPDERHVTFVFDNSDEFINYYEEISSNDLIDDSKTSTILDENVMEVHLHTEDDNFILILIGDYANDKYSLEIEVKEGDSKW